MVQSTSEQQQEERSLLVEGRAVAHLRWCIGMKMQTEQRPFGLMVWVLVRMSTSHLGVPGWVQFLLGNLADGPGNWAPAIRLGDSDGRLPAPLAIAGTWGVKQWEGAVSLCRCNEVFIVLKYKLRRFLG